MGGRIKRLCRPHAVIARARRAATWRHWTRRSCARRKEPGAIEPTGRLGQAPTPFTAGFMPWATMSSHKGRWMAAALSTGGVLSHRSAGALWGIRPSKGRIEITTRWTPAKRPEVLLHRAVLTPDEITIHAGIPVTTPARTQLDLAGVLQRHQLQQAITEAERQRLEGPRHKKTPDEERHGRPPRPGAPNPDPKRPRGPFHTFLNDRRFPAPQTNVLIEGIRGRLPVARRATSSSSWTAGNTTARASAFEARSPPRSPSRGQAGASSASSVTWQDLHEPGRFAAELAAFF